MTFKTHQEKLANFIFTN